MIKKIILLAVLAIPTVVPAQYKAKSFVMPNCKDNKVLAVGLETTRDTTITLNLPESIKALSLSGTATLNDWDKGHVRITLLNENDYEYLVYELYPLLADSLVSTLNHTALETSCLDNANPRKLKISVKDATLVIDSLHYRGTSSSGKMLYPRFEEIQKEQQTYIIEKLNEHLESRQIPWRAGETSLSWLTYEEKKSIFGDPLPDLGGYEYYKSGVFVMPDADLSTRSTTTTSPFVTEFDWRNRHGKNWMTPVKNQGWCQSCWIFAAVGTVEAYTNLYYNRLLNYNLSEQEIMHCIGYPTPCNPGYCRDAYSYIYNHGVVTENCMPYYVRQPGDPIVGSCDDKCDVPAEIVSISQNAITNYSITDSILKKRLFHAPFSISISNALNDTLHPNSYAHALVLTGYRNLQAGDSICVGYLQFQHITPSSPYVGKTIWICKETIGEDYGENGYVNFILSNTNVMRYNYLDCSIQSLIYTNDSIRVTDDDGDGYYFWGVGSKPVSCPSWIPDEPDGDDSDYTKGPMDEYGWLRDLNPNSNDTLYIDTDTIWNTYRYQHRHVCIRNNAKLTVCDTVKCYRDVSFTIRPNSTLLVNGGTMEDADVKAQTGSNVKIQSNGRIIPCTNKNFSIPLGAKMNISSGRIK